MRNTPTVSRRFVKTCSLFIKKLAPGQISLNFTYRFNQKKKRERPQRDYDGGGEGFGG